MGGTIDDHHDHDVDDEKQVLLSMAHESESTRTTTTTSTEDHHFLANNFIGLSSVAPPATVGLLCIAGIATALLLSILAYSDVVGSSSGIFQQDLIQQVHSREEDSLQQCGIGHGRWVRDSAYPLYPPNSCPFVDNGFRCQENGRPDSSYLAWRWQPRCGKLLFDGGRFDAGRVLEILRDERVVFVGDSIGRNQWESLICMLAQAVENKSRIYEVNGHSISKHTGYLSFRFPDHNCTVEYYRSPFLVPQTRPPPDSPPQVKSVLHLDTIDWTSNHWIGARIIVFNAGHWWNYEKTLRGGCYFGAGGTVEIEMTVAEAYKRAIRTVADWVEEHIDTKKAQVFFRTYSSVHFRNGTWKSGGQCHEETEPITSQSGSNKYMNPWTNDVVGSEFKDGPIQLLDITPLTDLRKDGHPSLWYTIPPAPKARQDCSHWCLPGVPDTWNLLMLHLAHIF